MPKLSENKFPFNLSFPSWPVFVFTVYAFVPGHKCNMLEKPELAASWVNSFEKNAPQKYLLLLDFLIFYSCSLDFKKSSSV